MFFYSYTYLYVNNILNKVFLTNIVTTPSLYYIFTFSQQYILKIPKKIIDYVLILLNMPICMLKQNWYIQYVLKLLLKKIDSYFFSKLLLLKRELLCSYFPSPTLVIGKTVECLISLNDKLV